MRILRTYPAAKEQSGPGYHRELWAEHGFALSGRVVMGVVLAIVVAAKLTTVLLGGGLQTAAAPAPAAIARS